MTLAPTISASIPLRWAERPVCAIGIGWAGFVALSLYHGWSAAMGPGLADPDALVRLVQIRDLLAGQSWYDLTQHRFDAPFGVAMHWSRLIDVPVASLILAFAQFVTRDLAERLAVTVWPLLLSLGYVGGVVSIAIRLAGRNAAWPAAIVAILCIYVRNIFAPGNIDHHNAQLVLTLWLTATLVRLEENPKHGVIAGVIAAAMMAIGMETIGQVALAGIIVALAQTLQPQRFAKGAVAFGVWFALASLIAYLVFAARAGPGVLTCDAISPPYLAAALIGGLGLGLSAFLARSKRLGLGARLAALAFTGGTAFAAAAFLAPQCLGGPYAELSAELYERWLSSVDEARPLAALFGVDPGHALAIAGTVLSGLAVAVMCVVAAVPRERFVPLVACAFQAMSVAIALTQVRGAVFAAALALPFAAWLIVKMRQRVGPRPGLAAQCLLLLAWIAPMSLLYDGLGRGLISLGLLAPAAVEVQSSPLAADAAGSPIKACYDRANYAGLMQNLPQPAIGGTLATFNIGAPILAYSPLALVAAPYHRQPRGILDSIDAFNGDGETAHTIIARRGLSYVMICQNDSLFVSYASAPGSFAGLLASGKLPPWLMEAARFGPLALYRVLF